MVRVLLVCLFVGVVGWAATLKGTITDPSGASAPDALVQLRGPGGEYRAKTDAAGQYTINGVQDGKYLVRVIAKGFSVNQKQDVEINGAMTYDAQLTIEAETQVVNVEAEANHVTTDPGQNGGALVLGQRELAALSDDPDELEQQLQAMAGPAGGPSGGQIYVDGFTGGNLPPKSSIREVRINSNPFSPEYDRPGFGRIEILTKPGTDAIRGQAFFQLNDEQLNSRLLAQSDRPPYQQKLTGRRRSSSGRASSRRRSGWSGRHVRRFEREEVQSDTQRVGAKYSEPPELCGSERGSVVNVFRRTPESRGVWAVWREFDVQPEDRCAVEISVLSGRLLTCAVLC